MSEEIEILLNENRIELRPNCTTFLFPSKSKDLNFLDVKKKAIQYAKEARSYVGSCYNQKGEFIGYYVPS